MVLFGAEAMHGLRAVHGFWLRAEWLRRELLSKASDVLRE